MYEIIKNIELPKTKIDRRRKPDSARLLAASQGLIRYQGEPCGQGHDGLRYTKGGTCVGCIVKTKSLSIRPKQRSEAKIAIVSFVVSMKKTILSFM